MDADAGAILNVERVEKKFVLSTFAARTLYAKARRVLAEDEHNGKNGYLVRSLYFDTVFDSDFFDKEVGIENRRKIRLRLYPPDLEHIKLEVKEKFGDNQRKRSLPVTREVVGEMMRGQYASLLTHENALAKELYAVMSTEVYRPKVIVEYKRLAFVLRENDIRITLDSNLVADESPYGFLRPHICAYPAASVDDVTLEVKYNNFLLKYIKEIVSDYSKIQVSVSKYYSARRVGHTLE